MDNCFVDITVEFLAVAFHNILYYAKVYPESIFETRKKYSVVVYHCIHPEVKQYIELCLRSASECLKNGQLHRVVFAITNNEYEPISKFVFDIHRDEYFDDVADAYLVQAEQNLRAFCLKLSSVSDKFNNMSEDCSFTINLHTNESSAVAMATNPDFEDFPVIEVEEKAKESDLVVPLRSFSVRGYKFDTYIETASC